MNLETWLQATLFTLVGILTVSYCEAGVVTAEPRSIMESPVLKEMEYKKSLYYNKKPGTSSSSSPPPATAATKAAAPNVLQNKTGMKPMPMAKSNPAIKRAPPSKYSTIPAHSSEASRSTPSVPATVTSKSDGTGVIAIRNSAATNPFITATPIPNSTGTGSGSTNETAASDRIFIPPYKMPFWGMPYGVYSNGGFINPGLFPFVPGGPGFPPYDGIFGSPFGPGGFPGNQSPFPKGTGTPMDTGPLPLPPSPYGQPPLNPTGRRSNGAPPGAYSPGSQMGYYYRRVPKKPTGAPPPKPKKKKKPKPTTPEPDSDSDGDYYPSSGGGGGGGCNCNKGKDDSPSYGKKPKPTTTTPDPCPCSSASPSSRPSYKKEVVMDDDDHYHRYHHHHSHDDDKYKSETPSPLPCPLATPPTTTEYVAPPTTPTTTEYYEKPTEPSTTTEYAPPETPTPYRTKKPCKLRHRPQPSPSPRAAVYYEYDTPEPTQMAPPTRKPCPLKQRTYEKNDYAPIVPQQSPPPPQYPQMAPAPVTIYQPGSPGGRMQQQYQPQYQPLQYQQPPQYVAAASSPQESHSTVLYKPMAQEIIQTPTSVTVPLPFPYVMDSNGMLQPQHNSAQNSQQVTYKVDLNQDLLTKITTPVVVTQPQQSHSYSNPQQHQQIHQFSSNGNHQYVIDGQPISISNSQPQIMSSSQPRIYILDSSTPTTPSQVAHHQPTVNFSPKHSGQSASPSVVVLKSDSLFDYPRIQQDSRYHQQSQIFSSTPSSASSPVTVSYVQPSSSTSYSGIPSYASIPTTSDYNIVLSDSGNGGGGSHNRMQSGLPIPYRTLTTSSYRSEQPPRRSQQVNRNEDSDLPNKNYVIIDRAELEELKKTFSSGSDGNTQHHSSVTERNVPPPPDVVHIEFHSKLDDDKENSNKPLSFHSEKSRSRQFQQQQQQQQQPKFSQVFVETASDQVAEGSSPFSRIFELNNDDIVSAGRRSGGGHDRESGSNHATIFRTSLVFDKYLKNGSERMK